MISDWNMLADCPRRGFKQGFGASPFTIGLQREDYSPGPFKEKSSPLYEKWKIIAIVSGIIALLLAVGLSATLGIFLTKTECGSPPKHNLATTDYLGSAAAGSKVSYVCPSPYVFPDDNNTFVVSCSNNLEWDTDEIPPCARQAKKTCKDLAQEENFSLSAYIEDKVTRLEVKLMFTGDVPDTFMVDLDSKEDRCAPNENLQNKRLSSFANSQRNASTLNRQGLREDTQVMHMIMVTDSTVNPVLPYEIRIRASSTVMAISFIQNDYFNITLFDLSKDLQHSHTILAQNSDKLSLRSVVYVKQLTI